jgi:hypothetical protein
MAVVTYWMAQESAATTGTAAVLRQVPHIQITSTPGFCKFLHRCHNFMIQQTCVVTAWPSRRHSSCSVSDPMSCHMQGQRVCLEAAIPGLLNAIVENANHGEDSFLQDPDIMVVYLEQLVSDPPIGILQLASSNGHLGQGRLIVV